MRKNGLQYSKNVKNGLPASVKHVKTKYNMRTSSFCALSIKAKAIHLA